MRTSFQFLCDPPRARLRIAGELDLISSERLRDVLWCVGSCGCRRIEVDLDDVEFVDAHSLALLDREQRQLRAAGGDLEVVTASPCFVKVTGIAGYDNLQPAPPPPPRLTLVRGMKKHRTGRS